MASPTAIPVILNPKARSELSGGLPGKIQKLSPLIEICPTEYAGHAKTLAYDLVKAGHRVVVAAGGDGTINEAASGLALANIELGGNPEEDAALGVLPTGTMNVFAVELGVGPMDLARCWRAIEMGAIREVDFWYANEFPFVQMAGVGFDAAVIKETSWESKKKLGPLSYALSTLSLIKRAPVVMKVESPGRPTVTGAAVLVGNGRRYGGPLSVFRDAKNDDGLLDLIVLHGHGYRDLFRLARGIALGGFQEMEGVEYLQAPEFTVSAPEAVPLQVDGEIAGETPVKFTKAERSLRVLAS